jgi:hypothetical protein
MYGTEAPIINLEYFGHIPEAYPRCFILRDGPSATKQLPKETTKKEKISYTRPFINLCTPAPSILAIGERLPARAVTPSGASSRYAHAGFGVVILQLHKTGPQKIPYTKSFFDR